MRTLRASAKERLVWLAKSPLFKELPEKDTRALACAVLARAYEAGEALFREGEEAAGFHVVVEGQVKVSRYGPEGREQVLHVLRAGEPCGEVPAFSGGRYPATAEALTAARTIYLSRERFLELGRKRPELLLGMLAVLSRRLRGLVELVDDLALKDVGARLARHLLDLSEENGGAPEVRLPTTKALLAGRLGTIPETLSRTLARMQGAGWIRVSGRVVALLDPQSLSDLAEGRKG
jgi:CRP/FNR family transcriptional regulator